MSHDRGCPCGREPWEYPECRDEGCIKQPSLEKSDWTQAEVRSWAISKFGERGPLEIAIRGNKEMSELLSALQNEMPKEDCVEECADVLVFLMQISEALGGDLIATFNKKMNVNVGRKWAKAKDGSYQHV